MEKILLIDGHSILNRAFYGVPMLTNYEGVHTNAVYGFVNIMLKSIEDENAGYVAVAFDLKEPTFRHKMYDAYKGTRKPMPVELHEQVPIIKDILKAMSIPVITLKGYEADDILGTLAKRMQKQGMEVTVLSGDRDLLQLADEHIKIRMPKTTRGETTIENYYPDDVKEKYSVTPAQIIELKALMGDASDNIPGVKGIGEKTATSIICQFGTIENAYAQLDQVKPPKAKNNLEQFYDMAVMSKKLATIDTDAPIEFNVDMAKANNLFTDEAYDIFVRLELKSLLKKFTPSENKRDDAPDNIQIISDFDEALKQQENILKLKNVGISLAIDNDGLYGAAFSTGKDTNIYIACEGFITEDFLKDIIRKTAQKVHLCGINIKEWLDYFTDNTDNQADDAALMAYLINPLKNSYLYDEIAMEYLDMKLTPAKELMGKRTIKMLAEEDVKTLAKICCYDACTAVLSCEKLMDRLKEYDMYKVYTDIEKPVMYVLKSMENEGVRVDRDALVAYGAMLKEKISILEKEIYSKAGEEFNINSPKQLGVILFEKMNLPSGKKTKTGYSTSADVLEKLAGDYPVVSDILEYRMLTKLKSTYADGLVEYISSDGRIHGKFNQTITATGRISSTEPNLQNIPIRTDIGRQIRKVFIPKEGYIFTDADYSQIELRLLAHMSSDDTLINAYMEDRDIHRITASKVFKTPLKDVTQEQRSNAKAVNFGIVYGISSFGLSEDLGISKKEAKEYIEEYFKTYPSIKEYLDGLVKSAATSGYSKTLYNRRRPVPEMSSSNFMQRQFGERIAMNSPLQGTAADIIKIAMINVYKRLKEEKLKSRLILQIHDELVIETAKDEEEQVRYILEEEMKNAASLRVKLEVDVHCGNNWYEAK